MEIESYLERISYKGQLEPNAQTLKDLQVSHLLTVPFENLSIHRDEPIILEIHSLFDKIVCRRRGGFCYELNGLFSALLCALGFSVDMLSAQVADGEGGYSPDFDHMVLLVSLGERWLADVGFGDTFREPLLLDDERVQEQDGGDYRISSEAGFYKMFEKKKGLEWKPQYRFDLTPYRYPDFEARCLYHQTSPESHFTQKSVCSLATREGRVTLSGMRLIVSSFNGDKEECELVGEKEYAEALFEHFGVEL